MQSVTNDIKNPALITLPNSATLNGLPLWCCAGIFIMEKIIGIYKITSPSNKIYIGQSHDIFKRWNDHKININYHSKKSKIKSSFIKYGFDNHKFEIIHECSSEQLNELEKYYVDLFQTFNSKYGLNLQDGGGSRGKQSDETKKKLSIMQIGKKLSEEHKRNISLGNKGRKVNTESKLKMSLNSSRKGRKYPHSEETKRKISESMRGKKLSPETKRKLSLSKMGEKNPMYGKVSSGGFKKGQPSCFKGKKHTDSAKIKISLSTIGNKRRLGKKASNEVKLQMSLNRIGKKHSIKTRIKMSINQKLRRNREKYFQAKRFN